MSAPTFEIEWKGRSLGSFTLVELRAQLASGRLSRMHRVSVQGAWLSLGAWLDQIELNQKQTAASAQEQARHMADHELAAERARADELERRLSMLERQPPQIATPQQYGIPNLRPAPEFEVQTTTSGLAISALIFGIIAALLLVIFFALAIGHNFRWLPLVFWASGIAWLLTTIFGHLALLEIRRDASTGGSGLAITGLMLGYATITVIAVCLIIAASQDDYRQRFNF